VRKLPRVVGILAALGLMAAAPPRCVLQQIADVPLRDDGGYLSIRVRIGDHAASLLVDTGSEGSLITPEAASAFGLTQDSTHQTRVTGTGGMTRMVPNVIVPNLALAENLQLGPLSLPVAALPGSPRIVPAIAGLLGGDVLGQFDIVFDVRRQTLAFWRASTPNAACRPPPAWHGRYTTLTSERDGARLSVAFTLDGRTGRALLDSGARSRIVSIQFAARAGVASEQLARDPGGTTSGIDFREALYHWHRFGNLRIGDEAPIRGPVLTVAPLHDDADMLLGADWFAERPVWLSYATNRVFIAQMPERVAGQGARVSP